MSKCDFITDNLLEIYNVEREILWEEAEARGFKISAEELRQRAREVIAGAKPLHSYDGDPDDIRDKIEPYDE